jgi:hypothetical protein
MNELPGLPVGLLADEVVEVEAWRLELAEGDHN